MSEPLRPGDVWLADLSPVTGSEQARRRPVVVISGPLHLAIPRGVAFVVPVTSRDRGLRHQIPITLGAVAPAELAAVRRVLRAFLDL